MYMDRYIYIYLYILVFDFFDTVGMVFFFYVGLATLRSRSQLQDLLRKSAENAASYCDQKNAPNRRTTCVSRVANPGQPAGPA